MAKRNLFSKFENFHKNKEKRDLFIKECAEKRKEARAGHKAWVKKVLNSTRGKSVVKMHAQRFSETGQFIVSEDYLAEMAKILRSKRDKDDTHDPIQNVKKLIRQKEYKEAVSDEIKKIYTNQGLDHEWIGKTIKKAVQVAEEVGKPDVILKAAIEVGDILENKSKTVKLTQTTTGFLPQGLQNIADEMDGGEIEGGIEVSDED